MPFGSPQKTEFQRIKIYNYLERHFTPKIDDETTQIPHLKEGVVYYTLSDLVGLVEESSLTQSEKTNIEDELRRRASDHSFFSGYVAREQFVRTVEQQRSLEAMAHYCRHRKTK